MKPTSCIIPRAGEAPARRVDPTARIMTHRAPRRLAASLGGGRATGRLALMPRPVMALHLLLLLALMAPELSAAWYDIAGAITLQGTDHVWQGCPSAGGWHHAASTDGVHWDSRGIGPAQRHESFAGMSSFSSPCAGFVAVDDDGAACAGFRQCDSTRGTVLLNPDAHSWDVPLELRCARNANLTDWGEPEYLFPVYYNRPLPYDPVRPWIDDDGAWYVALSADGCNVSEAKMPCPRGGALHLWTSPKLHGAGADWQHLGEMLVTNRTPLDRSETAEFVTSDFFGNLQGDPRGGATRIVTNNGGTVNSGSPIFYMGVQANGSKFLDGAGEMEFAAPGEIGMLDYGAFTRNGRPGAKGIGALRGNLSQRAFSMAKTLGGESANQVAKPGRRRLVAWGSTFHQGGGAYTFQTLLQDLTLAPGKGPGENVVLQQAFIPELQMLRQGKPIDRSQQFELVATISKPVHGRLQGQAKTTSWCGDECAYITVLNTVHIGVDFLSQIVFVDTTAQRNLMPVYGPNPAPVRAGPLLLRASTAPVDVVHVHAIVDHSIIAVIFNNRTSLTVATTPGEHDGGYEAPSSHSSIKVEAWNLATANENADSQKTPKTPWLLPKIHNSPVCL